MEDGSGWAGLMDGAYRGVLPACLSARETRCQSVSPVLRCVAEDHQGSRSRRGQRTALSLVRSVHQASQLEGDRNEHNPGF